MAEVSLSFATWLRLIYSRGVLSCSVKVHVSLAWCIDSKTILSIFMKALNMLVKGESFSPFSIRPVQHKSFV